MLAVFRRPLLLILAALLAALALALGLVLQTEALVAGPAAVSALDIARARDFLRRNDPRQLAPGALHRLRIPQQQLDLVLAYAASRSERELGLQLQLDEGRARLRASLRLPGPWWLNLQAGLRQNGGLPQVESLRLGRLPLPAWLGGLARERLLQRLAGQEEGRLAAQLIKHVALRPGHLELLYEWRADSYERMLGSLLPPAEQARLRIYSDRLVELLRARPGAGPVALVELLPPLFALAQQRSAAGQDGVAENRAALLLLAVYASGRGLPSLLPAARAWPQPRPLEVTLQGRVDFPQHFLVSAVLAMEGGGPLSNAIGVYKEVADTQGGSGFSFNDIAADRAGTRLGLRAVAEPQRLQQRLAAGIAEPELLPDLSDLPEFLSAAEFARRYGRTGSPAYQAVMDGIEARLDRTPLLAP